MLLMPRMLGWVKRVCVRVCVVGLLATYLLQPSSADDGGECIHPVQCDEQGEAKNISLDCPNATSLILVTNVTSSNGEEDDVMLSHVKRSCMGLRSCDVSSLCSIRPDRSRAVRFLCVQAPTDRQRQCSVGGVRVSDLHGFLQNPKYPSVGGNSPCRWQIQPPPSGQAVHLTLHDLDSEQRSSDDGCDGGLRIVASECNPRHRPRQVIRELCTTSHSDQADRGRHGMRSTSGHVTIVSCGQVEVTLTPIRHGRHQYPLRFWLGYTVKDFVESEPVSIGLRRAGLLSDCPLRQPHVQGSAVTGLSVTMTTTANHTVASASGDDDDSDDSTMTVLIVLVCVIGVIALALSIILAVVCVKRRRPKVELIEHVYAVPSACVPLSHTPLADDIKPNIPPEPVPRPHLRVQAYSDVADARPPGQPLRVSTPTSPPYAEVEDCPPGRVVDDRTWPRFHFRSARAASRPSVSSSDASSSHYEDVNPLPLSSSVSAFASAVSGSNTTSRIATKPANTPAKSGFNKGENVLANSSATMPKTTFSDLAEKRKSDSFAISVGSISNANRNWGKTADGDTVGVRNDKQCAKRPEKESPVYVHMMDSMDNAADASKRSQSSTTAVSKTQTDKSAIAPLAAKFSTKTDNSSRDKAGALKAKTEPPYSSRLYPLQEGRVASLVSTLTKGKEVKNGDVVSNKEPAAGRTRVT